VFLPQNYGGFILKNQASITQLNDILTENFKLHGNNSINIADFMLSLWLARTVNLSQIANYSTRALKMKKANIYRGFQYLIHNFKVTQEKLASGVLKMFGLLGSNRIMLALDRTNWQYGDKDINLLVLSVIINNCGVPLFWIELDSKGNSDTKERKELLNKFIKIFGANKIEYLLADREFIGNEWFDYLALHSIHFIIRIKGNMLIEHNNQTINSATLCDKANITNILTFNGKIDGRNLKIQATRSSEKKLVIVVSNDLQSRYLLEIYLKRWAIECLFGNLKTKGFNFEDSHFTLKERVGNLTKLLVLAHAIALLLGIVKISNTPLVLKKHGYKQHSYFREGLDLIISNLISDLSSAIKLIALCLTECITFEQKVSQIQQYFEMEYKAN
jgi:hypothetical protein